MKVWLFENFSDGGISTLTTFSGTNASICFSRSFECSTFLNTIFKLYQMLSLEKVNFKSVSSFVSLNIDSILFKYSTINHINLNWCILRRQTFIHCWIKLWNQLFYLFCEVFSFLLMLSYFMSTAPHVVFTVNTGNNGEKRFKSNRPSSINWTVIRNVFFLRFLFRIHFAILIIIN